MNARKAQHCPRFKKLNFIPLLLIFLVSSNTYGQESPVISLTIGDNAPPLKIQDWIKGTPITAFEKGKVYVLEFWATWCRPCKAAMPHLSDLAAVYKDQVTVIGIDVMERKTTSIQKVRAFVDSMGSQMNYYVAIQEANLMEAGWLNASGEQRQGIPRTFVVDAAGKLAWIGHPKDLDALLPKIINNTWNITQALNKRNEDRYLRSLDDSLNYELMQYRENEFKKGDTGKPQSALAAIDDMISKEPRLKYAPFIAYNTFTSLLKTNQHKAYEYAKVFLVTRSYEEPSYPVVYDVIEDYATRYKLSAEIYELGAAAHQLEIDQFPYPQLLNLPRHYHLMAELYWRANNRSKAIAAQQKAIEALKSKKDESNLKMSDLESRLQQFKKM